MRGAPPDVVCVGVATEDVIASVDRLPGPDERVEALEIVVSGGGPAATAAVALARQGVAVAFVGAIGDDQIGGRIRAGLEAENVDVSDLIVRDGDRSGLSIVLVDQELGTRTIINRQPPRIVLTEGAVAACREATWIHVDQAGYPRVAASGLLDGTQRSRPRLSVDAGSPIPEFRLWGVDVFAPTEASLLRSYPGQSVTDAMASARRDGAATVVVTRGDRGSLGLDASGPATAGGYEVAVRSTLGAGDVFHGQLVAELLAGQTLQVALQRANAAAAMSCRALDGRSAIPRPSDLDAFLSAAQR